MSGAPPATSTPSLRAQFRRRFSRYRAHDVYTSNNVGQLLSLHASQAQQGRIVVNCVDSTIVRHPMQRDGAGRRRAASGETQVEVILGLKEFVGLAIDFRPFMFEEENVGDGILARVGRDAACAAQPGPELIHAIAFDAQRSPCHLIDIFLSPTVHPDDGVVKGRAFFIYRNRARPLARAADSCDPFTRDVGLRQHAPRCAHDGLPPLVGILLDAVCADEVELS